MKNLIGEKKISSYVREYPIFLPKSEIKFGTKLKMVFVIRSIIRSKSRNNENSWKIRLKFIICKKSSHCQADFL